MWAGQGTGEETLRGGDFEEKWGLDEMYRGFSAGGSAAERGLVSLTEKRASMPWTADRMGGEKGKRGHWRKGGDVERGGCKKRASGERREALRVWSHWGDGGDKEREREEGGFSTKKRGTTGENC